MKNIQNAQNRFVESQDIDYESEDEDFHPSVQIQIDQLRCMMEKMISVEERQHLASVSDQDERLIENRYQLLKERIAMVIPET